VREVESENQLTTDYVLSVAAGTPQAASEGQKGNGEEGVEEVEDLVEAASEEEEVQGEGALGHEPSALPGTVFSEMTNLKARLAHALEELREQRDQTESHVAQEVAKFKEEYEKDGALKLQSRMKEKDKEFEARLAGVKIEQQQLVEQFQAIAADSHAKQQFYEEQTAMLRSQIEERDRGPVGGMFIEAARLLQDVKTLSENAENERKTAANTADIESLKEELYFLEQQKDEEINLISEEAEKHRLQIQILRQMALQKLMQGDHFNFQRRCWLRAAWQVWRFLTRFSQQKNRKSHKLANARLLAEQERKEEICDSRPLPRHQSIEIIEVDPKDESKTTEEADAKNSRPRAPSVDCSSITRLSNWLQELIDARDDDKAEGVLQSSKNDLTAWRSALDALLSALENYKNQMEVLTAEVEKIEGEATEQRVEIARLQLRKSKYAHGMASQLDEEIRLRESLSDAFKEKEKRMEQTESDQKQLIDCLKSEIKQLKEALQRKAERNTASDELSKVTKELENQALLRLSESAEWNQQKEVLRSMVSESQGKLAEANKIIESIQGGKKKKIASLFKKKASESDLKIGHFVASPGSKKDEDPSSTEFTQFMEPPMFSESPSPYENFDWKVNTEDPKQLEGSAQLPQSEDENGVQKSPSPDSDNSQNGIEQQSLVRRVVSGAWSLTPFRSRSGTQAAASEEEPGSGVSLKEIPMAEIVQPNDTKGPLFDGIETPVHQPPTPPIKEETLESEPQITPSKWKEFDRQSSRSSITSSVEGGLDRGGWNEVLLDEPAPPIGIDSPVIDNLLENWSDDGEKVDYMKLWLICTMEDRPRPADMPRNVQLLSISPAVKDGFLMLVYPLLKTKRNVVALTRQRTPKIWDLRLKVLKDVESSLQDQNQPNSFSSSLPTDLIDEGTTNNNNNMATDLQDLNNKEEQRVASLSNKGAKFIDDNAEVKGNRIEMPSLDSRAKDKEQGEIETQSHLNLEGSESTGKMSKKASNVRAGLLEKKLASLRGEI